MVEFPKRIDVMPTAHCNLECPFCWGPDHSIKDGLDTNQWFVLIASLKNEGIREIVFTGGEPLIRPDIKTLAMVSHLLGLNVTLSTNCLLLEQQTMQQPNILDYVHEIGIPIDGSSEDKNKILRKGRGNQFDSALKTLSLVQSRYPQIHTTVRTVVTQQNINDIFEIGNIVSEFKPDRWKLYEHTPIAEGLTNASYLEIGVDEFNLVVKNVITVFPELTIEPQYSSLQSSKYLFVGPKGDFYSIASDLEPVLHGNPLDIGNKVIENIYKYLKT